MEPINASQKKNLEKKLSHEICPYTGITKSLQKKNRYVYVCTLASDKSVKIVMDPICSIEKAHNCDFYTVHRMKMTYLFENPPGITEEDF